MAEKKGIEVKFNLQLKEIKYNSINDHHRESLAVFTNTKTGQEEQLDYGWLATYPECKVTENLKPFLENGLISLDQHTLQHTKYPNVFSFGECTDLPTINNSIAAMNQAHVVAGNVGYIKQNMPLKYHYDGTSATPIFTGMQKLVLPGFKYGWEPVSTKLAQDISGTFAGIKQSLSFKVFAKQEKKYFEKKMHGKIYGPPNWTKPSQHDSKPADAAKAH